MQSINGSQQCQQENTLVEPQVLKTVWGHFELPRADSQDVESTVQATDHCETSSLSDSSHYRAAVGDQPLAKSSFGASDCAEEDTCDDGCHSPVDPGDEQASEDAATPLGSSDDAAESGECTQVMIRNILNRYSKKDLMLLLDKVGLQGMYNGVYLPIGRTRKGKSSNLGYGFVDFKTPEGVEACYKLLRGYRIGSELRLKLIEVVPATSHFPTRKFHKCPTATGEDEQSNLPLERPTSEMKQQQQKQQQEQQHFQQPQQCQQHYWSQSLPQPPLQLPVFEADLPFYGPSVTPAPVGQPTPWECLPDVDAALPIAPPPGLARSQGPKSNLDHRAAPFYPPDQAGCGWAEPRATSSGPPGVFQQPSVADTCGEVCARFSF